MKEDVRLSGEFVVYFTCNLFGTRAVLALNSERKFPKIN